MDNTKLSHPYHRDLAGLNEFIDGFCGGDSKLIACAEAAWYRCMERRATDAPAQGEQTREIRDACGGLVAIARQSCAKGASPVAADTLLALPEQKPIGWLAGGGTEEADFMYHRIEDAQRECDEHNAYERSRPDFTPENLRAPEPVYAAPVAASADKPFPAPGLWFSVDLLGNPMREYAPGKWENCVWPSSVAATADAAPAGAVACATATGIYEAALSDAAFYVAGHCVDGDHHAEIIAEMKVPEIRIVGSAETRNAALEEAAQIFDAPVRAELLNSDVAAIIRERKSKQASAAAEVTPAPATASDLERDYNSTGDILAELTGCYDENVALWDLADRVRQMLAAAPAAAAGSVPDDPLDTPLPCDITVGAVTIRQGVKLRTLVTRMESLHRMAKKAFPEITPEQRAEFEVLFAADASAEGGKEKA